MNWQYYGLFLDKDTRNRLLEFVNNDEGTKEAMKIANKVYLDHCTLLHKSQDNKNIETFCECCEDAEFVINITEIGISRKAMAFKVEIPAVPCTNKIPHITIATFDNGKPVDSNNIKSWFPLEKPIKIVGTLKRI